MSAPQLGGKVYSLVMFVVVSVLAGLLVAGLFVPFAAMAGTGGRMAANSLENLPAELETPPPSVRSKVLLGNGEVLAEFYDENRIVVPLEEIAPIMRTSLVAIEDTRFYQHGALDLRGTLRALATNSSGGDVQGGSTLTQQYVKQVQIETAQANGDTAGVLKAQERSLTRKIQELRYAVALESKFSKDEILNRYLNIAYFGDGAYGVEAAARHYFQVSAKDLNLAQAAMIAGLVQNPVATDPVNHPAAAMERRAVVLNRMAQLGLITADEANAAKAVPFDKSKVSPTRNGCVGTRFPFLCDYVRRSLLNNPSLGATPDERSNTLLRQGITVQTNIDPSAQQSAQDNLSRYIYPTDPLISTMIIVEPGTGLIKAMAQSRPQMGSGDGQTYYNYAVERSMGGAEGYQAGSTFKAFTTAAALDRGIPASKRFQFSSPMQFKGQTFLTCENGQDVQFKFNQDYNVENSTVKSGDYSMSQGAAMSVNTYFMQLEQVAGICQSARMADTVGVKMSNGQTLENTYRWIPSFTLGVAEVTPLSMATAYATFAARGVRCDPIIVKSITSRENRPIATQSANCRQVMRPEVADGVNYVLSAVMKSGGTGSQLAIPGVGDMAGKTGTIDSNAAVWFAGYTSQLAGVAMIAVDKDPKYASYWAPRGGSLKGISFQRSWGRFDLAGSGSGDAGRIWEPAMTAALKAYPVGQFVDPTDEILNGKKQATPRVSGSISDMTAQLEAAGYTVRRQQTYDNSRVGSFVSLSCEPYVGGTCTIYTSLGPRPQPTQPAQPAQPTQPAAQPTDGQQPTAAPPS